MARKTLNITKKDKTLNQAAFLNLIDDYINDSYAGRRTKKNGARISTSTVDYYMFLRKHMIDFTKTNTFELKLYIVNNLTQKEKEIAKRYYKKFYEAFTNFLYDDKGHFDNYVGHNIKCLRCFFNYLEEERNLSVGTYHKSFFVPREEIPIIALDHHQLHFFIYNKEFNDLVKSKNLHIIKDIFVFGCTVALRISDLSTLDKKNLLVQGDKYYIRVRSQKTNTYTSIKLPGYAQEIIRKYEGQQSTLLPISSKVWINSKLKQLGKLIPDDYEMVKTRQKRGKQTIIYKDPVNQVHYRLSDHMTTHTMRRTAITTMLALGMPEYMVRRISGHAANSKEFFRYVQLSQSILDIQTDLIFDKLKSIGNN